MRLPPSILAAALDTFVYPTFTTLAALIAFAFGYGRLSERQHAISERLKEAEARQLAADHDGRILRDGLAEMRGDIKAILVRLQEYQRHDLDKPTEHAPK